MTQNPDSQVLQENDQTQQTKFLKRKEIERGFHIKMIHNFKTFF